MKLEIINITKKYGDKKAVDNLSLTLTNGVYALLGANGSGKTTLFNIIMGRLTPDSGKIKTGPRVKTAYYDQTQSTLNLTNTIFDEISDTYPAMDNTAIRSALAVFLFKGEDVFKEISTLSGGERARVSLCKLMLSKANFLFLDEPTNHLDIPSKEALENALLSYNGTLFIISHDRYFINKLATKIYEISKEGEKCVNGSYDYYLSFTKRQAAQNIQETKPVKGLDFKQQKELESAKRKLRTKISKLEETISEKEMEKESIEKQLSMPENASDFTLLSELTSKLEEIDIKLMEAMEEWEMTQNELEEKEKL
ncbi:MAG: ABC-F family ATP-binding cassette domain-containing protein [Clostridia bacterium]|nr:ABC-F family ATP-binding cassette domain-containing protein [Clostridia bacterium]